MSRTKPQLHSVELVVSTLALLLVLRNNFFRVCHLNCSLLDPAFFLAQLLITPKFPPTSYLSEDVSCAKMNTIQADIASNLANHREEDWAVILSSSDLDIDADEHDISPSRPPPYLNPCPNLAKAIDLTSGTAVSAATLGDSMDKTDLISHDDKADAIDDVANSAADDVIDDIFEHSYVYDLAALLPSIITVEDEILPEIRSWSDKFGNFVKPIHALITNSSVRTYNATLKCDLEEWQHRINAKEVRIGKSCVAEILLQWEKLAMAYVSYAQLWLEPNAAYLIYSTLACAAMWIPLMMWTRPSEAPASNLTATAWFNSLIFDEELVPRWFLAPRRKRTIKAVNWASKVGANLQNVFFTENVPKKLWAQAMNSLLWVDVVRNKLWVETTCSSIWVGAWSQIGTLYNGLKPPSVIYRDCTEIILPLWSKLSVHTLIFSRYVRLGAMEVEEIMSTFARRVRTMWWP